MIVFLQVLLAILIAGVVVFIAVMLSSRVRRLINGWRIRLLAQLPGRAKNRNEDDSDHTEIMSSSLSYAYLLAKSPDTGVPSRITLHSDRSVVVGRNRHECDVVIREHSISRQHTEFSCRDGQVYIRNLSQKGGTFVNRKRLPVDRQHRLEAGDVVHFFKYEYGFYLENESTQDMGEPDTVHTPVDDEYDGYI